jgi:hypothetical protein
MRATLELQGYFAICDVQFDSRRLHHLWTFEGNQSDRRLISFTVSGRSFQSRFFPMSPAWVELTKKQSVETKAVESLSGLLEKIGPTTARFPPKMLLLTDQWVDFSPCRAIAPTLQ